MQRAKHDVENPASADCLGDVRDGIVVGMDGIIQSFLTFMGRQTDVSKAFVTVNLEVSTNNFQTGIARLAALSDGRPTPTAIPYHPTPTPVGTPMPIGSKLLVDDWEISVSKVVFAATIFGKVGWRKRRAGSLKYS